MTLPSSSLQPPPPEREFIPLRPAEQKAFRRRRKLSGPEWAVQNIQVPIGARQGAYQHKNNPPLYGILDLASRPHVRTVVLGKGIQTGGTLGAYILLLREGDYSQGGDNALVVTADEATSKRLSKGRLQKLIDKSPALSAIKSSNPDETSLKSITLSNGFTIEMGWASSEMSVSSESYRVVILDELSKYKKRGNIQDAKGRTTTFPDTCKIIMLSSPGVYSDDPEKCDPLYQEKQNCDVAYHCHVCCPDCGVEQVMELKNFKWPEQPGLLPGTSTANPAEIRRLKSAWYECPHCQGRWNDYKRDKAVLAAMEDGWQPDKPEIQYPQSIYVHYPSWLSPYMSLSEVVARWLEAQGDDEKLQKWWNLIGGETYKREIKERFEDKILALAEGGLPRLVVPRNPSCLMLLVDTQRIGFFYEIVAFGWGRSLESWQIDHGFVEHFTDLVRMVENRYFDADGNAYAITIAFIDSGGGTNPSIPKHSRTKEVYDFCIENPTFKPLKGRRDGQPWDVSRREFYPGRDGKKVPIPGGLNLYTINVTLYKNELARKLMIAPHNPGAFHLHAGTDMDYAKQMCVEYQDDRGHWICPSGKANHFWDIGVYRFAAADIARVGTWIDPGAETDVQDTAEKTAVKKSPTMQKSRRW